MSRLLRVARNVFNLSGAGKFYEALGFTAFTVAANDAVLAAALGVERAISQHFLLGAEVLELTELIPNGAPYPTGARSNDVGFQHIAIRTRDIAAMQSRALHVGATPITCDGPQLLPRASGGVIAWKFRDPEGHPVEFLEMPGAAGGRDEALTSGYDHSAICVTDVERSIRFYETIGLSLQHRHLNRGPAQARLDGLEIGLVDVVAMAPTAAPPHVELLAYPGAIEASQHTRLSDISADRLVFACVSGRIELARDPDGHVLMGDGRAHSCRGNSTTKRLPVNY